MDSTDREDSSETLDKIGKVQHHMSLIGVVDIGVVHTGICIYVYIYIFIFLNIYIWTQINICLHLYMHVNKHNLVHTKTYEFR
jgi:hypothetical protein